MLLITVVDSEADPQNFFLKILSHALKKTCWIYCHSAVIYFFPLAVSSQDSYTQYMLFCFVFPLFEWRSAATHVGSEVTSDLKVQL